MILNIYVSSEQRSGAVVPLEHYVPGTFGSGAARCLDLGEQQSVRMSSFAAVLPGHKWPKADLC